MSLELLIKLAKSNAEKGNSVLFDLIRAKQLSDKKNYTEKAKILNRLLKAKPGEFYIDSRQVHTVGLTHEPTGFKIHTTKGSIPLEFIKEQAKDSIHEYKSNNPTMRVLSQGPVTDREFLYHASGKKFDMLDPKFNSKKHFGVEFNVPVVFAGDSPSSAFAATPTAEYQAVKDKVNDFVYHRLYDEETGRKALLGHTAGGYLYKLPASAFTKVVREDHEIGGLEISTEYLSHKPVKPISVTPIQSTDVDSIPEYEYLGQDFVGEMPAQHYLNNAKDPKVIAAVQAWLANNEKGLVKKQAEEIKDILEALQNSKFKLLKHKELVPREKSAAELFAPRPHAGQSIYEAYLERDRDKQLLDVMAHGMNQMPIVQRLGGLNPDSNLTKIMAPLINYPGGLANNPMVRAMNGGNPVAAQMAMLHHGRGLTAANMTGEFKNLSVDDTNKMMEGVNAALFKKGELVLNKQAQERVRVFLQGPGNKFYLQRSFSDPTKRRLPGGGIEPGETPLQTAKRELFEEYNFKPKGLKYLGKDESRPNEHVFYLKKHPVEVRKYVAKNDPNEINEIILGMAKGKNYRGPTLNQIKKT